MKRMIVWVIGCIVISWLLCAKEETEIFLRAGPIGYQESTYLTVPREDEETFFQGTGRYAARNLFDNDNATCWALGNGGIGEKIYISVRRNTASIALVNGLAKSKELFSANNRVKGFSITGFVGYSLGSMVTEIGRGYTAMPLGQEKTVILEDTAEHQEIAFPFDWKKLDTLYFAVKQKARHSIAKHGHAEEMRQGISYCTILCLTIKEIYKGTKYNDTCLSELALVPNVTRVYTSSDGASIYLDTPRQEKVLLTNAPLEPYRMLVSSIEVSEDNEWVIASFLPFESAAGSRVEETYAIYSTSMRRKIASLGPALFMQFETEGGVLYLAYGDGQRVDVYELYGMK